MPEGLKYEMKLIPTFEDQQNISASRKDHIPSTTEDVARLKMISYS